MDFEPELERLLEEVPEEILKICFDTGHHSYAGFDPVAFMKRHMGRISYMHFKDIGPEGEGRRHRPMAPASTEACGQGNLSAILGRATWISPPSGKSCSIPGSRLGAAVEQDWRPDARRSRPSTMRAPTASYLHSRLLRGRAMGTTELGNGRRRRRQPDRPGAPAWARRRTGISCWPPGRLTWTRTRVGPMPNVSAWPPTGPMATGAGRCWRGSGGREDRVDLVTVATPNSTHFEITKGLPRGGLQRAVRKADDHDTSRKARRSCASPSKAARSAAVNYCLLGLSDGPQRCGRWLRTGRAGEKIRLIVTNFSHGHHGDATDADNPRVALALRFRPWRVVSGPVSPIAASTRCTWPVSSPGIRWTGSRPTSPRRSPPAFWKTMRW